MENKFIVTIEKQADLENTRIAHFEGDFDGDAGTGLEELQGVIDKAMPKITLILDFSKLHFLNSYAIGHIVSWHTQISQKEGRIIIVAANKNIEDIFNIVGVSKLFKIYPDMAAAVEDLKNKTT